MPIEKIDEVAPDDPRIERWIEANKSRFREKYGDKWKSILYATAWRMYKSKKLDEALIERSKMPQIKIKDYGKLEKYLADNKVGYRYTALPTRDLQFVQDVNHDIMNFLKNKTDVLDKPIIVSKDMIILDGNHRAYTNGKMNRKNNVLLLDCDFREGYKLLTKFSEVEFRDESNARVG